MAHDRRNAHDLHRGVAHSRCMATSRRAFRTLLIGSVSFALLACAVDTDPGAGDEVTGETAEAVQTTCSVPVYGGAYCRQGTQICSATSCTCQATYPPVMWATGPERCEQSPALDDDCDGFIDDGCPVGNELVLQSATPLVGGPGGNGYGVLCPADSVMTGFYGANQHGGVISGLDIRCAPLDLNTLVAGQPGFPLHAGGTGWDKWSENVPYYPFIIFKTTGFDMDCPTGQVMIGLKGRSGSLVDSIRPQCGDLHVTNDSQLAGTYTVEGTFRGEASFWPNPFYHYQNPGPGNGGGEFSLSCGTDGVVLGIYGRAGSLIDAIGLYCGRVRVVEDW